jgi:8-oxo-dGTP pyrophosphatase MutT (NUDIX family)
MSDEKRAAGVLIVNPDGTILALNNPHRGYCIPCGKVSADETFEQAAIREAREETGLDVALDQHPYLSRDVDGFVVATFKAHTASGKLMTSGREGTPEWIVPEKLMASKYGQYNRDVLAYFEIDYPES